MPRKYVALAPGATAEPKDPNRFPLTGTGGIVLEDVSPIPPAAPVAPLGPSSEAPVGLPADTPSPSPTPAPISPFDGTIAGPVQTRSDLNQPTPEPEDVSWLDSINASLRHSNPLSMAVSMGPRPEMTPVSGYSAFADNGKELVGYEAHTNAFTFSRSPAETRWIKDWIDQERRDDRTRAHAGWTGMINDMAAGMTNPILWLSAIAGPPGLARTIGQVALAETANEAVLHAQQYTRTWEESAINIVAAAAVTGIIGGAVHVGSRWWEARHPTPPGASTPSVVEPPFHVQEEFQPGVDRWTKNIVGAEGKVVGTSDGVVNKATNELVFRNQFVNPDSRGQGFGGKAFVEVVDHALNNGMIVKSDSSVTIGAAKLYEKLDPAKYTVTRNPNAKVTEQVVDGTVVKAWKSENYQVPVFTVESKVPVVRPGAVPVERAAAIKQLAEDIQTPGGAGGRDIPPTNINAHPPEGFEPPPPAWTPESVGSKADVPDVVAKHLSYGNVLMRLMSSPANTARSIAEHLFETPMYLRKNRQGLPSEQSVETLIKVDSAPTGEALQALRDAFNKSQGFGPGEVNFLRARIKAGWRGEHAFKEEVGRVLRGNVSDDPLATEVAAVWREKVFDPLKERAMKLELFPEQQALRRELTALEQQATKDGLTDELTASIAAKTEQLAKWTPEPKGADSYLTRLYNYQKLAADADNFKASVIQYLKAIEGYTEADAAKTAKAIHSGLLSKDNMFGIPKPEFRGTSRISGEAGGPLKERTVTLPDNILEPWLISDIEHVGRTYTRRMATEINLAEKFGDRTMQKQIAALKAEYETLVEAATTKKDKLILQNALRANIRDVEAMRDMLIGTYGLPSDPSGLFARGNRMARSWQYAVALGMQTISAVPDLARPIVTNGLMAYTKGLSMALPFMAKMAKEDVKRMGIGLDMLTSGRMRAIATMDEIPLIGGKFEHGIEEVASGFGKVSGMDQWNSFWKQYTGIMAVDRIAQMAERGWTNLKPGEQAQLAWLGIDGEALNGIRGQFAKHGSKEGVFNVANIASWDHGPARNLMAAATKEADTLIVSPGKGDKPLLASTDIGKTLMQFQSFTAAATNRMLISGIAQKDLRVIQGLFMGTVLGALGQYTKDSINGRNTDWANDPALIVARGLKQAGTLGLVAQIPADVASAIYEKKPVSKAIINAIPGVDVPAESILRAGANMAGAAQTGDSGKALKAASGLLPYQNLFYLRQLFNEMGDGERSALGLKMPEGKNKGPTQFGNPYGG